MPGELVVSFEQLRHCLSRVQSTPALNQQVQQIDHPGTYPVMTDFRCHAGGELICEHEAAREALRCWGIDRAKLIRPFSREQEQFLSAHREVLRC